MVAREGGGGGTVKLGALLFLGDELWLLESDNMASLMSSSRSNCKIRFTIYKFCTCIASIGECFSNVGGKSELSGKLSVGSW